MVAHVIMSSGVVGVSYDSSGVVDVVDVGVGVVSIMDVVRHIDVCVGDIDIIGVRGGVGVVVAGCVVVCIVGVGVVVGVGVDCVLSCW